MNQTIIDGSRRILHGGDYNPDQWLDQPEVLDEDFRMMKLAGCNTFTLGVFSWAKYEPEEGQYDFSWLDQLMDRMSADGHKVILATPSGGKPVWMAKKYPEIRRVLADGRREPIGQRHNHCWSSPVYREKVQQINRLLAERYKDHPALGMWHISNEYGNAPGGGWCYCDRCIGWFHQWLQERYGTLEQLNKSWWSSFWSHTYTAWDQIDPRDDSVDGMLTDWSRFNTHQVIDFYKAEREPLEQICPDIPKTTNLMGFFGRINYWELVKHLDVIGDDSYPALDRHKPDLWKDVARLSMTHDFMRTAAKQTGRPWMLMESAPSFVQWTPAKLKSPGMHRSEALNAIAHGAEGVLYFQWRRGRGGSEKLHAGIVDHEGSEKPRVFREVAGLSRDLDALETVVGTEVNAEAAVIVDWESRWQLRDSWGTLSHWCIQGNEAAYDPAGHYRELWHRSIATDIISTEHDFSGYKLIIAPQLFMLKPGVAEKIRTFVEQGGVFVGTYYTGYVNESGLCLQGGWPGDGLRAVFGVWNEEYDLILPGETRSVQFGDGPVVSVSKITEVLHSEGAEALACHTGEFYAGAPVVTVNRLGKGAAVYIAAEPDETGYRLIYDHVLELAGVHPPDLFRDKPDAVSVRVRENPHSGERFAFITNWSNSGQRLLLACGLTDAAGETVEPGELLLAPFECIWGKINA